MPKVGVADRLFLSVDSEDMPQHAGWLAILTMPDGAHGAYLRRLSADLREVTTVAEPFNYRLRNVRLKAIAPAWDVLEDSDIDLDYHFRHSALPEPGGERELGALVSRLHSRPLDPTRPLWEFHIIEGLENNRFAVYGKVHQALMDGIGGVHRMTEMVSPDPDDRGVRPLWSIGPVRTRQDTPRRSPSVPGRAGKVLATARAGVSTAGGLAKAATSTIRDARNPEDSALGVPFVAPKSALNRRIGRQRRVATQAFDFARMSDVAAAGGVTVTDVFLAICAGGLRRYLDELGDLPDKGLLAGIPVRISGGDLADRTANAFTMTVMKLFTDVVDPVERIGEIARSRTIAMDRLGGLPSTVAELYGALVMGPVVAQNLIGLGGRVTPPYNVVLSHLAGPLETQYLAGSRLEAMYPLTCLSHGSALVIAAFASSGTYGVGFTGDRDALPHLQRLAVYTGAALMELEQALADRVNSA